MPEDWMKLPVIGEDELLAGPMPAATPAPVAATRPVVAGNLSLQAPKTAAPPQDPGQTEIWHIMTPAEVAAEPTLNPLMSYRRNQAGRTEEIGPVSAQAAVEGKPPTVEQGKAANFLGRTARSNAAFEGLSEEAKGPRNAIMQWLWSNHPDVANYVTEQEKQVADQNVRDFIGATLRLESGAAIGAREYDRQYRIFFPMPGDGPDVIEQKRLARQQAIKGFEIEAGSLAPKVLSNLQLATPKAGEEAAEGAAGQAAEGAAGEAAEGQPPEVALSLTPEGKVIHPDQGAGTVAATDTGLIGEQGGAHTETNPELAGVNNTINTMLKDGSTREDFAAFIQSQNMTPEAVTDLLSQWDRIKEWQAGEGRGYTGDYNIDVERRDVPNTAMQNVMGSDVGAAGAQFSNMGLAMLPDEAIAAAGGDPEQLRTFMAASQAAHPKASIVGGIAGGATTALGIEAALGRLGLPAGLARIIPADVLYGAMTGAGGTDYGPTGEPATMTERLKGGAEGAAYAGIGSLAGGALPVAARPAGNKYVRALNKEGVPLTVGQQYGQSRLGGLIKRTEETLAGLPFVGDIFKARQIEGFKKFNENEFNYALKPIKGKLKPGSFGDDAINEAQDQISDAFEAALQGKKVTVDPQFANDFTAAVQQAQSLERVGPEIGKQIYDIVKDRFKGTDLTGETMQQVSRELRDLKASYYAANEPMKHAIGKAVDAVEDSIFGAFRRQTPDVLPAYNAAKVAQTRLYTLADAVNLAKNREGLFRPSDLGRADKRSAIKLHGRVGAAGGKGEYHVRHKRAQEVLPNKLPDSGTAGRFIVPAAALTGGGAASEYSEGEGAGGKLGSTLTWLGVLSAAYSRPVQRVLTKAGRGATSRAGRRLRTEAAARTGRSIGTGAALETQAYNRDKKKKK